MTTQAPTTTVYRASQTGADLAHLHLAAYMQEKLLLQGPHNVTGTHNPSDEGQMEPTPITHIRKLLPGKLISNLDKNHSKQPLRHSQATANFSSQPPSAAEAIEHHA